MLPSSSFSLKEEDDGPAAVLDFFYDLMLWTLSGDSEPSFDNTYGCAHLEELDSSSNLSGQLVEESIRAKDEKRISQQGEKY